MEADYERVAEDRYDNYASLSRLFRIEIDKGLLQDLCASPVEEPQGNEDFSEGYRRVRAWLDGVGEIGIDKAKSQLAIDYNLVFIGYGVDPKGADDEEGAFNAAYPYETVYTTGRKTLSGGDAEGISSLYREWGFRPTRYRIAADDHIACELEFLQYLVGQEILAFREGDDEAFERARKAELDFLEQHPLKWIELFAKNIERLSETGFYPAVAQMTKGWLVLDQAYLRRG